MELQKWHGDKPLSYWVKQTDVEQRIVKGRDVVLTQEAHNPRVRSYRDPFGQRLISLDVTELETGGASTLHRQLHESTMLILSGQGHTIANGKQYSWGPGDALQVPLFMWHQHVNTGNEPVRYLRFGTVPFYHYLGLYRAEQLQPPAEGLHDPRVHDAPLGEVVLIQRKQWQPSTDVHRFIEGYHGAGAGDKGMKTKIGGGFGPSLVDPGYASAMHRHWDEAIIYILEGKGFTTINEERYEWEAGDFLCVPLLFWHRHHVTGNQATIYLRHTSSRFSKYLGIWIITLRPEIPLEEVHKLAGDYTPF